MSINATGLGWRDAIQEVIVRGSGANDPSWAAWRGNLYAYQFEGTGTTVKQFWSFIHLDHDYCPGTDIHLHVHYVNNTAAGSGNVKWQFEYSYAQGHDQDAFPAATTTSVTQAVSGTQYQHQIAEVSISDSTFETDGIIALRIFRDPDDAADTYGNNLYVLKVDAHYQTDHYATPSKAPDFFAPFDGN